MVFVVHLLRAPPLLPDRPLRHLPTIDTKRIQKNKEKHTHSEKHGNPCNLLLCSINLQLLSDINFRAFFLKERNIQSSSRSIPSRIVRKAMDVLCQILTKCVPCVDNNKPRVDPAPPSGTESTSLEDILHDYEIRDEVGSGTYSHVFRADVRKDGSQVAIKIFEKRGIGSLKFSQVRDAYENEISILGRLPPHPNVISFIEVIDTPTHIYLVEGLEQGGNLFEFVSEHGPISLHKTRKVFHQACLAVEHLHACEIVHRDIKLEHFLFDRNQSTIKLCDFGFAQVDTGLVTDTPGSPAYCAPELLLDQPYHLKPTDIWALGIVLYMMCFGEYPFWSDDRTRLYTDILEKEPSFTTESRRNSKTRQRFTHLIQSMIKKNPKERPTISQVLEDLSLTSVLP